MTNFQRVKEMSPAERNEALSAVLKVYDCSKCKVDNCDDRGIGGCREGLKKWLSQEANEHAC